MAEQIEKRLRGERVQERLVSLFDPDARPIRKGKPGRTQPNSRRTQRRLARYRTGAEGRVSHLKRRYGLRRSRLKGGEGERIWKGWAAFAYNLDTYGLYA